MNNTYGYKKKIQFKKTFYSDNPSIREYIHKFIVNICIKENLSSEQVFSVLFSFYLLLCLL